MQLVPCHVCNRTFNDEAIERHTKICEKSASKVRKKFNSENQRKVTDELSFKKTKKPQVGKPSLATSTKKSNWREKHQEFVNTIRAARGVTQAIKQGKELPPPPPPALNPDYVSCPHCERRFNETAAERHIKFCADQHKRLEVKMKVRSAVTSNIGDASAATGRKKYTPPSLPSQNRNTRNSPGSGISKSATKQKSFFNQNNSTFKRASPQSAGNKPTATVPRSNNIQSRRKMPDFVIDFDPSKDGHGRTKTGLKPRQLAGDSTRRDNTKTYEESYSPSFGPKAQSKSRKTASTDYMDFLNGDYSSIKPEKYNSRKNTVHSTAQRADRGISNNSKNDFRSEFRTPPVATVAPVKSHSEMSNHNLFYEDYNYKSKYTDTEIFPEKPQPHNDPQKISKFCHECGDRYPLSSAKFCCNCGMRRLST